MTPFEVATALVVCLREVYEGNPDAPAEICHRPGSEVPLGFGSGQNECCTGLGWVRITSIEPVVDALTTEQVDFNPCNSGETRMTLEMGVARCLPFGTKERGPTCEQWTMLAQLIDADASAMRRALCCAIDAVLGPDVGDRTIVRARRGAWTPLDSAGGCAGGTMTVNVWTDCAECELGA